ALGQIFWYTLEGRDPEGNPAGGWDPQELRSIQDFYVKYGLTASAGVAEVASIGGFVKEYQVDIDPEAMKAQGVNVAQIIEAVKNSNLDIGARTIEYNRVEYLVRAIGYIEKLEDLEEAVVAVYDNIPVRIEDVAKVNFGPATRRGGLDKGGAEAVGGVVVARYGANPMATIENLKDKIKEISPGLPSKELLDGTISKVTIVPFYDRSGLIKETLGTLEEALTLEILISILVVILLVLNLRASLLISSLLPIGTLMTFIVMRRFGVDANIVALSGIAIAIGVMVDVGVVFTENILRHTSLPENLGARGKKLLEVVYKATTEVGGAVITAVMTTIVSFLPVFAMEAAEGKLFKPLAFTKTFAMLSALVLGLIVIPTLAHIVFSIKSRKPRPRKKQLKTINIILAVTAVVYLLTKVWMPLGAEVRLVFNFLFVIGLVGLILGLLMLVVRYYTDILSWCLRYKWAFLSLPILILVFGIYVWRGMGKEFMPSLDEGSFLLMPTTMPHSGIEENLEVIAILDKKVNSIPEVENVVGKWGRVNSALDPAPTSMYENVILYRTEYILNEDGHRVRFRTDRDGAFILNDGSSYNPETDPFRVIPREELTEFRRGNYFRQWRPEIKTPDDIWKAIIEEANIPGLTSAPKLQPISTRLVMLQTGMRAPMGIKVYGPDLESIEKTGFDLERHLKSVPGVEASSVFADRVVGKPYLELDIKREALARYGLSVKSFQMIIGSAVGGMALTHTVEGRERYPVRVRYAREYRDNPEDLLNILIPTPSGSQVPLNELADLRYTRGPQMIKSENTFLVGYVIFDKKPGYAEVDVVENAQDFLGDKIDSGEFNIPAGVNYVFTGNYENQIRATKRLLIVIPISLLIIFLILYFQFRSVGSTLMIFSGILVALSGGFIMIWLYGQQGFLDFNIGGTNMQDLFQIRPINLSVAVWVGFIALFGVATDDGVLISTYLKQLFAKNSPKSVKEIRALVLEAGKKRVRPAVITTATTLIALLPVLTSTGKGSDIMVPMAIPLFGGMAIEVLTMFVVPVLYSMGQEIKFQRTNKSLKS
ncbi:MAG: efflux RND transporter permease subunit, partial [Bacteroidetes bacterium]|nr:efflux RND transporter permease subunit [Bacteroidota bacterium]